MLAVIINVVAIIIGTTIGLIFRKVIKSSLTNSLLRVLGIVVIIVGIVGIMKSMIVLDSNGRLQSRQELFLLIIIMLGMFIGELLKIDDRLSNLGIYIDSKFKYGKISEGFITASVIYVVGAMGIVGSINAALGDPSILYLKSALDGITAIVFATTLGIGVGLSFLPVLIYQGLIFVLAYYLGNFLNIDFIDTFNLIGFFIVTCIGFNFIVKEKIKVANLLPSLVLVIIYYLIF